MMTEPIQFIRIQMRPLGVNGIKSYRLKCFVVVVVVLLLFTFTVNS